MTNKERKAQERIAIEGLKRAKQKEFRYIRMAMKSLSKCKTYDDKFNILIERALKLTSIDLICHAYMSGVKLDSLRDNLIFDDETMASYLLKLELRKQEIKEELKWASEDLEEFEPEDETTKDDHIWEKAELAG